MSTSAINQQSFQNLDYDLHGVVGIRLLNASPREATLVTRQLGPIQAPLIRDPDITIRFVDHLPNCSRIRYIGVDDAGFTDEAFLVLRSKHKSRAKVQISFEEIGKQCEIICERGLPAVPLLIPIVNLTMLNKGAIPLHASAFTYQGTGMLATGWAKGGKTETLLAFTAHGAEYVGDEWVYLSSDGQQMYGIPEPIKLWYWHLQDMQQYWAQVGWPDRTKLRALKLLVQSLKGAIASPPGSSLLPVTLVSRAVAVLEQQLYVHMSPQKLFGQTTGPLRATPDKIFFVVSHEKPDVMVQPMDSQEIARRMVFSLQYERLDILTYYLKFRFAFPEVRNGLIEQAEAIQHAMLSRALANKEAFAVYHPYPVPIPALFDAIHPLLNQYKPTF